MAKILELLPGLSSIGCRRKEKVATWKRPILWIRHNTNSPNVRVQVFTFCVCRSYNDIGPKDYKQASTYIERDGHNRKSSSHSP